MVDDARRVKKDLLIFKVNFEKAYDFVDWKYLDDVIAKMNFQTLWRKWIIECVITTMTSVLVNGSPTFEFKMKRGLRQGDPLFPLLFMLAAEGDILCLNKEKDELGVRKMREFNFAFLGKSC